MKNIHILKTDQPSRLIFNPSHKSFCIQKELNGMYINDGKVSGADFWGLEKALNNGFRPQHLYITNGEEIKEGNWYLFNNQVFLAGISTWEIKDRETSNCKKIILTTDTTLIADGIQEIDDTFLEWFVKNPTCEYVEVEKQMLCTNCGREYCDNLRCRGCEDKPYYEIIIPFEVVCIIGDCDYLTKNVEYYVTSFDIDKYYLISDDGDIVSCYKEWFEVVKVKQAEPKQEGYSCPHTKIQCDDECCVSAEDCHITSSLATGMIDCKEPKQETLEESNEDTAIRFLEWYRRRGVVRQFHAYHIPGNDETIYLSAQQLFAILKKENYESYIVRASLSTWSTSKCSRS
jgi:hypothetical protein